MSRQWKKGDHIALMLETPVELVAADPRVKENAGKRAVQRGPLVYCLEQADNKEMENVSVRSDITFEVLPANGKLAGLKILKAKLHDRELTFIPYFAWDNREAGKMKVWTESKE
jgi:hypothetical protein